jgi:hypothetical protein
MDKVRKPNSAEYFQRRLSDLASTTTPKNDFFFAWTRFDWLRGEIQ